MARSKVGRLRAAVSWPARKPDGFYRLDDVQNAVAGSGTIGNIVAAAYGCINLLTIVPGESAAHGGRRGRDRNRPPAQQCCSNTPIRSSIPTRDGRYRSGKWVTHGNGHFIVLRSRRLGGHPVELVPAIGAGAHYRMNGQTEYSLTPLGFQLNAIGTRNVAGRDVDGAAFPRLRPGYPRRPR